MRAVPRAALLRIGHARVRGDHAEYELRLASTPLRPFPPRMSLSHRARTHRGGFRIFHHAFAESTSIENPGKTQSRRNSRLLASTAIRNSASVLTEAVATHAVRTFRQQSPGVPIHSAPLNFARCELASEKTMPGPGSDKPRVTCDLQGCCNGSLRKCKKNKERCMPIVRSTWRLVYSRQVSNLTAIASEVTRWEFSKQRE